MSHPPTAGNRAKLFRHRPGLDGLRGLSVVAVVAFHGGFGWAKGGYLGVSAFFTLSGFLIATLLLRERDVTGEIDLRGFWWRRARRLLPAGLLGLLLAIGYAAVWSDSTPGLRGDVLACLGYVANWRFIFDDRSYADLFADPSPVQHYWSLAVEEQFYVVFPLIVVGCAVLAPRRFKTVLLAVAGALCLGSIVVSSTLSGHGGSTDRVYYGTDARAAEILIGVLAALALLRSSGRQRPRVAAFWVTASGVVGLAVMVMLWSIVDQGDRALHPWLLLMHAVTTVVVINSSMQSGPVADVLSWRPLRALGKVSYGIYVFHWPVFLALSPDRTGLSPVPLFGLRIAVTLVLAGTSWRWIERPILANARLWRKAGWARLAVPAAAVVVVLAAAFAVPVGRGADIDFDAAAAALESDPPESGEETTTPLRVKVFGDSVALMSAFGLDQWGDSSAEIDVTGHATPLGCPILEGGELRYQGMQPVPAKCNWAVEWTEELQRGPTDVAVVHFGTWDIVERRLPGYRDIMQIGDPDLDEQLSRQIIDANELLLANVSTVVWLTLPVPATFAETYDSTIIERVDMYNSLMRASVASSSGRVQVVDMAEWIATYGPDDRTLRPDGVHFSDESSLEAGRWLGPAILHAVANPDDIEIDTADVPVAGP